MGLSRRKFLGSSAAAVVVAGTMAKGKVFGANDRIRVANMGIHGQGGSHIRDCVKNERSEVVALCDVDANVLSERIAQVKEAQGTAPKGYTDIRDLLTDDSIDVLTIATPNHWHSLAAIWACKAGKDVYVEKPLSHNVWEGRQLVAAAAKYGRIVQHGTQQRSSSGMRRDIKLMHDGFIGDIVHSRGYVYKNGNRHSIGHGAPATPPAYLDWNLWQGPAQETDYLAKPDGSGLFVHYNWHWTWPYGNGEIGNQGVHEMDVAVWGHNRGEPVRVQSMGGRYAWDDDGNTPNTQATCFTYEDGSMLTFEVRNLGSYGEGGSGSCSNAFFGTEGYYVRGVGFFDYQNKPIEVTVEAEPGKHKFDYFFDAVISRKQEDASVSVEDAHVSCVHCHLGNVAYRLGTSLEFCTKKERFVGDDHRKANKLLDRDYRDDFEVPKLA